MNQDMKIGALRAILILCLVYIIPSSIPLAAADVTEFLVDSTEIQVYRDGLARITQTITVNETMPAVTFPLLGSLVDNFIVQDENHTVLDYDTEAGNLTVYTLGATSVSVQCDTHSLTSKNAEVWAFLVDSPYNLSVLLPEDSTIVYLSGAPTSIDSEGDQIVLSLFAGNWEVSYIFPLNPPAVFEVSNLKVIPNAVSAGDSVTISVTVTNLGGQTGSYNLPFSVNQTLEETKSVTLEGGELTTVEFKVTKDALGTYDVKIDDLSTEFTVNDEPSGDGQTSGDSFFPTELLIAAVAIVVVVVAVLVFPFFRKKPNTNKIFRTNPRLNQEEKDVIQFLVEHGGKAFEAEIRENFPSIPRTSLWRLVKRLEKMGIISIKKIGLENRVELKK
jgi:uncharacterized membrane protein